MDRNNNTELFNVQPTLLLSEVEEICKAAIANKVAAVVLPPLFVKAAKSILASSEVAVVAAIGFPYGYSAIEAKIAEILLAIVDGADMVEVLINTTALKNQDWQYLANEINYILPLVANKNKKIRVVLETNLLTDEEIIKCSDLYGIAGVHMIAAGTGTDHADSKPERIALLRKHLTEQIPIKGVVLNGTKQKIDLMLNAGASRIAVQSPLPLL